MSDLQQAIHALTAAQQQLRALRADTDLLVQEVPNATEDPVRARLQRLVPRLGTHMLALSSGWERTNQALLLAGQLPQPIVPPADAASGGTAQLGPPAAGGDAEVAAAAKWCAAVSRQLEQAVAVHLMAPLHDDAAAAGRALKRHKAGHPLGPTPAATPVRGPSATTPAHPAGSAAAVTPAPAYAAATPAPGTASTASFAAGTPPLGWAAPGWAGTPVAGMTPPGPAATPGNVSALEPAAGPAAAPPAVPLVGQTAAQAAGQGAGHAAGPAPGLATVPAAPPTAVLAAERNARELERVLQRVRRVAVGVSVHACNEAGAADVKVADASELRMLCPRVFCASVVFARRGGLEVVRISVDAATNAGNIDGWVTTEHQVFRRLSTLATRALAYFTKRSPAAQMVRTLPNTTPDSAALEDLLLWLSGYQGLFSTPCRATGRLLAIDASVQVPMPPIFRPFKLSRPELLRLASHPSEVRAYHMHAAPAEELGWCEDNHAPPLKALGGLPLQQPIGSARTFP